MQMMWALHYRKSRYGPFSRNTNATNYYPPPPGKMGTRLYFKNQIQQIASVFISCYLSNFSLRLVAILWAATITTTYKVRWVTLSSIWWTMLLILIFLVFPICCCLCSISFLSTFNILLVLIKNYMEAVCSFKHSIVLQLLPFVYQHIILPQINK